MENNKDINLIEKYLNNQLSAEERAEFEGRLQKEEEFSTEFERHQMAHKALDFLVAKNLKAQLQSLEEEDKVLTISRSRGRRILFMRSAAAAVVLLMIGFFYFYFPQTNPSGLELASSYYETPDYNFRSASAQQNTLSRGIAALEAKDFAQSITTLDSINSTNDFFIVARYFQAHAYYQSQKYSEAETAFTQVSTANDLRYQEDAEWYTLLSCLAQNKDCKQQLEKLSRNSGHSHYEKAILIEKNSK